MSLKAIYYDTETTGISAAKDRIIEIAAYDPVHNRSFCQLVNPGMPIPADATAIHHITDEMVQDAPSFQQLAPQFIEFCAGDTLLIAHNNDQFDVHFLRKEFQRCAIAMPPWQFLDSLKWARTFRPDLPRHSLQFLREIYGHAANTAHRALDDVMVLAQVFQSMIDDLSIETVVKLLCRPRQMRTMPFGKHRGVLLEKLPADYRQWLAGSGALDKQENQELKESLEALNLL